MFFNAEFTILRTGRGGVVVRHEVIRATRREQCLVKGIGSAHSQVALSCNIALSLTFGNAKKLTIGQGSSVAS
jgi:hypothetical protein